MDRNSKIPAPKSRLPLFGGNRRSTDTTLYHFNAHATSSTSSNKGTVPRQINRASYVPSSGTNSAISSSIRKSLHLNRGLFSTTPQKNRLSTNYNTAGSQSARRSSTIGDRRHFKDNRPLQERSFHQECISHIIKFLTSHNYPHQISKSFLQTPTSTEVAHVFEFLFNLIDPKLKITPLDTQIPFLMQKIGYPYQINKSCLVSASSNNARGQLLGMMSWLVDSVTYFITFDAQKFLFGSKLDECEVSVNKELLNLTLTNPTVEQVEEFCHDLCRKKYGTQEDVERKIKERDNLNGELNKLNDEIDALSKLPDIIKKLEEDIKAERKYNDEMFEHINMCKQENKKIIEEISLKTNELNELEKNKINLIDLIEKQEYNLDDIKMLKEREKFAIDSINDEKKRLQAVKIDINSVNLERIKQQDLLSSLLADLKVQINSLKENRSENISTNFIDAFKMIDFDKISADNIDELFNIQDKLEKSIDQFHMSQLDLKNKLEMDYLQAVQNNHEAELEIKGLEIKNEDINIEINMINDEIENLRKEHLKEIEIIDEEIKLNQLKLNELNSRHKRSKEEVIEKVKKANEQYNKLLKECKEKRDKEIRLVDERYKLYKEMAKEIPAVMKVGQHYQDQVEIIEQKRKKKQQYLQIFIDVARAKLEEKIRLQSGGDSNDIEK